MQCLRCNAFESNVASKVVTKNVMKKEEEKTPHIFKRMRNRECLCG